MVAKHQAAAQKTSSTGVTFGEVASKGIKPAINPFSSILSQQEKKPAAGETKTSSSTGFGGFTSSTSQPSFPTTSLFSSASSMSTAPVPLFGTKPVQTTTDSSRPTFSSLFGASQSAAETSTATTIFGRPIQQQQQLQQQKQIQYLTRIPSEQPMSSMISDATLENLFQSIYIELIREIIVDFLFKEKFADSFARQYLDDLINQTITNDLNVIMGSEIHMYR